MSRAAGGVSFADFAARYVDGREPYPWDVWLPKAGWRLATDTLIEARLGVVLAPDSTGLVVTAVDPRSVADLAGVRVGDVLEKVAGVLANDPGFFRKWSQAAGNRAGAPLDIEVRRSGRTLTLHGELRFVTLIQARVEDDTTATSKAQRIRRGILTGTVSAP